MKPDGNRSNIKNHMSRQEALELIRSQPTCDIPEFGWAAYGLDRNGSYALAKTGILPLIQIGKRKKIITAEALKPLGIRPNF